MHVLAIIPARSGSKEIPKKNIRKLAGKPLITHTILAARRSKLIDKIVVSTDNKKIAQISKLAGAEVPFLRPKKISSDNSSILYTIKHTLKFLHMKKNYVPDVIILLQPTSPLRTSKMIDYSINMLKESDATSILSVSKVKTHPFASFWFKKNYLKPFINNFSKFQQRQRYPDLYYPTGDIYVFWYNTLKKYNSIYGPKIKPMIIKDGISVDVDKLFDLFICEMTILYWEKYKKFNA